jgi:hypothetical protein
MYEDYTRLLSFCSVRHAIMAETTLHRAGIKAILLPTPRAIGVNCGQCLLFMSEYEENVLNLLQEKNIYWTKLFKRDSANRMYELFAQNEEGTINWEV